MKVFLGGTCANSTWREKLIPMLKCDYFNPVVEDWTPECQENEEREKKICDYHLYVITPKMKGVFSIAEAVNDSRGLDMGRCIFCVTKEDDDREWENSEFKSLCAVSNMVANNGGVVFGSINDVADYLNEKYDNLMAEPSTEKQLDYYVKRTNHLIRLYNTLVGAILPEGWYGMGMDTWTVEEEECAECLDRLNRRGVQRRIKK